MPLKKLALLAVPACLMLTGIYFFQTEEGAADTSHASHSADSIAIEDSSSKLSVTNASTDQEAKVVVEEDVVPQDTGPWISQASTELSSELYDYIESEQLKYIDISTYPFDLQTEKVLRSLSQSGEILLFDNTEADRLSGIAEKPEDIIADYFGTASAADAVVATSIRTSGGGTHFMVLPVPGNTEQGVLAEDIKAAVALLKEEKEKKATL
ncbi:hypothetical protein [Hahella ganghwensis]|uniref:hypothetical protein n=1 Tax=Hahella ganghwensis TaxID=286420 RepID=UPI00038105BC|nr:hypothetical protein [Hahella ganghwensis]